MTLTDRDGVEWGFFPILWCKDCADWRPHHGPYCCSCGCPSDGIVP